MLICIKLSQYMSFIEHRYFLNIWMPFYVRCLCSGQYLVQFLSHYSCYFHLVRATNKVICGWTIKPTIGSQSTSPVFLSLKIYRYESTIILLTFFAPWISHNTSNSTYLKPNLSSFLKTQLLLINNLFFGSLL